jgi:hypothetical protein
MRQVKFGNPIFHNGLNTTVRFGRKWIDLSIGEIVDLADTQGRIVEVGRIVFIYICLFRDLPMWITSYLNRKMTTFIILQYRTSMILIPTFRARLIFLADFIMASKYLSAFPN